nr:uncharacterized protein LOC119178327 [Rhipicephalus microplus]
MSRASLFLVLLVFSPFTGGQGMRDECQAEQIINCTEQKFSRLGFTIALRRAARRGADEIQKAICSVDIQECTSGLTHQDCPEDMKIDLVVTGTLIAEGFNALCENQGLLLKALLNTYECWNIEVLISCIEQLSLMTESYEASEQTDQDLKLLKNELNSCATRSKINSQECAQVDVSAMEKLIHNIIGRIVPEYNSAPQACSSAATLLSTVLTLVLTRWN